MDVKNIRKKLLTEKASKTLLLNVPGYLSDIFSKVDNHSENEFDFVILFAHSLHELKDLMERALSKSKTDAIFWACYPKGSSKIKSDINRNSLFDLVQHFGVRPVTQVSIDETWTAMRLRPHESVGKKSK